MKRVAQLGAAVSAVALLATGCGSGGGGGASQSANGSSANTSASNAASSNGASSTATGSGGTARSGGTFTFAYTLDPECVDPQQAFLIISLDAGRAVTDSLTDQNPQTGQIVPWLATKWTINGNGTAYTFTLRPGVTFSDGEPLTAQVVKENFDDIVKLGPKAAEASTYLAGYTGTTVVNNQTFTVHFSQPNAQFLEATATISLGLLAPKTLAESPADRCAGKNLIGTGPFTLQSYTRNQQTVLVRRPGYNWPSPLAAHKGDAYLDKVVLAVVPNTTVDEGSLESGQAQLASINVQDKQKFGGNGYSLLVKASPGFVGSLQFNQRDSILRDIKVRQAISEALNRQQLALIQSGSGAAPATSVLAPDTPGYADESQYLAYNPKAAEALLDADGWTVGPGGIRVKDGKKLTLDLITYVPVNAGLTFVQQELKAIGVDLEPRSVTQGEYASLEQSGKFQVASGNQTRADPDILRDLFSSKGINYMGLPAGTQLDSILSQEQVAINPTTRYQLAAQAQKIIVQDADVAPEGPLYNTFGESDNVHGLRFEASARLWLYDTWLSS